MVSEVGELLAGAGLWGQLRAGLGEPVAEGQDQRLGALLPDSPAPLGGLAHDLGLDPVELGDPAQAFRGDRRGVLIEQLAQLPPAVRPAMGEPQRCVGGPLAGEGLVSAVAIHLQHAGEAGEHRLGMRRAAARGIEVDDAGWIRASPAAVVTRQCPEIAGLGSTAARVEDRRLGLVHEQLARGLQMPGQTVDDRLQVERCLADPIGQHRAAQVDPGPGIDLRLTVERQVVGILGDQHMGEQRLGGQCAFEQVCGCRGLHNGAGASAAGIFRPNGHDNPELSGGDVEPLTAVFPDPS